MWVGTNGSIQDGYCYENNQWGRFDLVLAGRASTGRDMTAVSRMPNTMEVWWIGADGSVVDSFYYDPQRIAVSVADDGPFLVCTRRFRSAWALKN
jgi:hypothetical protein